jgi:hypothetical protein
MKSVYYDRSSGDLRAGRVWRAEWHIDEDDDRVFEENLLYAKFLEAHQLEDVTLCYRGPGHATDVRVGSIDVDLLGKTPGNFVKLYDHGFSIVTDGFVKQMEGHQLTGLKFRQAVRVTVNQSDVKDPKLSLVEITGNGGFCHRFKIKGGPNACPHCGRAQVICDYCGTVFDDCPSCGREMVSVRPDAQGAQADTFGFEGAPKTLIVANRDWDGSDIFAVKGPAGGVFISRRAKEFFEKSHIFEVHIEDALLDMSGV